MTMRIYIMNMQMTMFPLYFRIVRMIMMTVIMAVPVFMFHKLMFMQMFMFFKCRKIYACNHYYKSD